MRPLRLSILCTLALVSPVQAQDPQVDPGSPAGTEYQLPVDRAREEAGGASGSGNSQDRGTTTQAPLFGSGVESEKSSSAGKSGTESERATVAGDERVATPETVLADAPSPDRGGALVAVSGGAIGVLLLGGVAGLAWRRRSSSS